MDSYVTRAGGVTGIGPRELLNVSYYDRGGEGRAPRQHRDVLRGFARRPRLARPPPDREGGLRAPGLESGGGPRPQPGHRPEAVRDASKGNPKISKDTPKAAKILARAPREETKES